MVRPLKAKVAVLSCQLDRFRDCLGDKSPGTPVRDYLALAMPDNVRKCES